MDLHDPRLHARYADAAGYRLELQRKQPIQGHRTLGLDAQDADGGTTVRVDLDVDQIRDLVRDLQVWLETAENDG